MGFESYSEDNPFRDIYSVSRLNREVKTVLEDGFPLLWIEGEISNFARPASGHWYFSLKDEAAQVRCAMFRNRNMNLGFTPENGNQVLIRARISLYEARGEYQLIAEHMEDAGDGALRRAFEALKKRLDQEGLFSAEHKKSIPEVPKCVGVVTSPSGAAIRDILTTLKRRFPSLPVIVYPTSVQGAGATDQIVAAIETADRRKECDVLVLARGGGSLEDLWCFNEEKVARAVYACNTPIVTGIGHEIDFTIADFVADQRAPTPTAAAEMISPDQFVWLKKINQTEQRLYMLTLQSIALAKQQLEWLRKRLVHPERRIEIGFQRLDELESRMGNAIRHSFRHMRQAMGAISAHLLQAGPTTRLTNLQNRQAELQRRLYSGIEQQLSRGKHRMSLAARALDAISPLATLSRGYAIVTEADSDRILTDSSKIKAGKLINARLEKGRLTCRVEKISME